MSLGRARRLDAGMNILCLTPWFPYPPDNGARIRLYYLLKELGTRHSLDLLSFVRREEEGNPAPLGSSCRLIGTVPFREFHPHAPSSLLRLFSRRPRSVLDTYSVAMASLVGQALRDHRYDVVLAFEIGPGIYTSKYVIHANSVPRVAEDLEISMIWGKVRTQGSALKRWRHSITWWKQQRYTVDLLRRIEGCTVVSERERKLILDAVPGYRSLAVVPNGVDVARYGGYFGSVEPNTLVYPGALTYRANFDAMEYFLADILPRIQTVKPDVLLRITGRNDGVDPRELALRDGVVLTGHLDDIRPAVAQSWVCVVPLRIGGGTRLKILEAMALGTPVISTSKGAEGLEVTPGEDILIADEPAEFADAVLRLLSDASLRARLAVSGRRWVEEHHAWKTSAQKLEKLLTRVVERGVKSSG